MATGGFVAYYRVSTDRQGKSGLGIEAQKEAVQVYLNGGNWHIVEAFTEVESGRKDNRPALAQALAAARVHRCPLVVAKLDRLTRSVAFLSQLLAAGVEVRFCDLPQVEGPQGRFLLNAMVAVAELETGLVSQRTKAALAAAKARGTKLGGKREGAGLPKYAQPLGPLAMKAQARARADDLMPTIKEIQAQGMTTITAIANELNQRGIPTARGIGKWHGMQVKRLLAAATI